MKKNLALFTLLIVSLGTATSLLPRGGGHRRGHGGGHRGHRGHGGWGHRGWGRGGWGGVGFSIGVGSPYGGYGPYYGGYYPSTVVVEKETQATPSFSYWNITNNTNQTVEVSTNADQAYIRPGQTVSVNRGSSYNLSINGKQRTSRQQNIEIN